MTKNTNQYSKTKHIEIDITFLEIIIRKEILKLIMFLLIFN